MQLPKDHAKEKIEFPLTNPNGNIEKEIFPHIKKFERQAENSTQAEALEQSIKIFGPFRKTPRVEKSALVKSQENSFSQAGKSNSDKG